MEVNKLQSFGIYKSFDYKAIRTFEDACKRFGLDPGKLPETVFIPTEFRNSIVAGYKLCIIYKAINNKWTADWNNPDQYKYYPWFKKFSSGVSYTRALPAGSVFYTNSGEKAHFIAANFKLIYLEYLLFK